VSRGATWRTSSAMAVKSPMFGVATGSPDVAPMAASSMSRLHERRRSGSLRPSVGRALAGEEDWRARTRAATTAASRPSAT
jgi:hypothetical protein